MTSAPVSSRLVPRILRHLRGARLPTFALERRFGLEPGAEGDSVHLSVSQVKRFTEEAAALAKDEYLGIHVAEGAPKGEYGLLEYAVRNAPTVRAALELFVERLGLPGEPVHFSLAPYAGGMGFHLRVEGAADGYGRHGNELSLATLFRIGRDVLRGPLRPERVWFAHPRPPGLDEVRRFFQTEQLAFDAESTGAAFSNATLASPLVAADLVLHQVLVRALPPVHAETVPGGFTPRVRSVLLDLLAAPEADLGVERVSRRLGCSARSLQRNLEAEGTSFRTLVTALRRERAEALLREGQRDVTEISRQLGFFDARSFSRAFKQWTGVAPLQFAKGSPPKE